MINPAATKRAALDWMAADDGLRFQVLDAAGRSLRIDAWGGARLRHGDRRASAAPLLSLLEDERASSDADGSLLVPHAVAAGWDAHQIAQLGLPPVAPFRLSIQGHGILSSPGFRFRYRLETDRGRAVVGAARQGVILQAGARSYTLLDPLYALIDGMDRYNAAPPDDVDSRFAAWGEMQALLPEDAVVDRHLRSMTIVRADALTLDPRADDNFDPVLLAKAPVAPEDAERGDAPAPRELLTPAAQRHFATRFEHFPDAKRRYALEGNWFVMVPEPVRKVLDVVRAAQREPPERRRAFLANPFAEISDRLSGQPEPGAVEALFQETPAFLSRRVERLGEWRPKAKAFVSDTGTIWFPDDFAGAEEATSEPEQATPASADATGDSPDAGLVHATPDELPRLIDQIQQGRAAGQATVDWKGQPVPTDPATEKRLAALVPVIKDNLEALDFVATPRSVQGDPGGLPANLSSTLYPHQQAGLDWLQAHWASGSPGCLLADDMGLGKTLQTLAFLSWVRERCPARAERKPHLVVAPTGLLRNWEAEAEQHLADPWLGDLVRAYGPELRQLRGQPGNERRRYLRDRAGWVLTTYETLRDRIALFVDVPWRVLVFDEAQRIKNPGARVTDMAKSLDAELTVALTGTPVENSLTDLWSIIDTVQPGALGSHTEFKSTYAEPAEADVAALEPLRRKLEAESTPQILLRRMKQDHLRSLPVKHECCRWRSIPAHLR